MASIELTQVILAQVGTVTVPPQVYVVKLSESPLTIRASSLNSVGMAHQADGTIMDVREIYITGSMLPLYVTDSYEILKAYIDTP